MIKRWWHGNSSCVVVKVSSTILLLLLLLLLLLVCSVVIVLIITNLTCISVHCCLLTIRIVGRISWRRSIMHPRRHHSGHSSRASPRGRCDDACRLHGRNRRYCCYYWCSGCGCTRIYGRGNCTSASRHGYQRHRPCQHCGHVYNRLLSLWYLHRLHNHLAQWLW